MSKEIFAYSTLGSDSHHSRCSATSIPSVPISVGDRRAAMFCDFIEELQKARCSVPGFDEEKGRTIVFWLMRPNGRRPLKDLYRSSRFSEPTMRTALKRLADQGFVSLTEDIDDQRQTFAQATPKLLMALDSYRALFTKALVTTDQSSEMATPPPAMARPQPTEACRT